MIYTPPLAFYKKGRNKHENPSAPFDKNQTLFTVPTYIVGWVQDSCQASKLIPGHPLA